MDPVVYLKKVGTQTSVSMNTYSRAALVHIVNEDKPFLASLKSFMCEMYLNAKNRLFYTTCRVVIETENSVGIEAPRSKSQIIILCARLAQLVRSLTANQKVPGSIPGLVEG